MKTIKVNDGLHGLLKELSEARGETIAYIIGEFLESAPIRTDLDVVLDQINLRFDGIDEKLGSPKIFSENVKEASGLPLGEKEESLEAKKVRLRLEEIVMKKSQQHAINHEEDCDQTGGWS